MLALIAGQGRLPVILSQRLSADNKPFQVIEMAGFPFENPRGLPVRRFRIEHLGSLIDTLVREGVQSVCFAGSLRRPEIDATQVDALTRPLLEIIKTAIGSGDDAALRALVSLFSARGLGIRAADEIAPELLPEPGVPSRAMPTAQHKADAVLGGQVLAAQGAVDAGQASIISGGNVLGRETRAGTDAMLATVGAAQHTGGGFLFKGPKPGQDRRFDLPTIGPASVSAVRDAGLDGIVIEAGGVLVLDLPLVLAACDAAGLFLWIREHP